MFSAGFPPFPFPLSALSAFCFSLPGKRSDLRSTFGTGRDAHCLQGEKNGNACLFISTPFTEISESPNFEREKILWCPPPPAPSPLSYTCASTKAEMTNCNHCSHSQQHTPPTPRSYYRTYPHNGRRPPQGRGTRAVPTSTPRRPPARQRLSLWRLAGTHRTQLKAHCLAAAMHAVWSTLGV